MLSWALVPATPAPAPMKDVRLVAANYHFTRQCNYACGFCFHTAKSSHVETLDNAKKILQMLATIGCQKINFAGGEPFLPPYRKLLGEMVKFAKTECKFSSVSIISNGVYVSRDWLAEYGEHLDILGISCDSSNDETNSRIGRGKGGHTQHVRRTASLCHEFGIFLKINTVANRFNVLEDMSDLITELKPMRWKIFQVLPLNGENAGAGALRDVSRFLISDAEFEQFVTRHQSKICNPEIIKVEGNSVMRSSYVLVDEFGRFLDSSLGGKQATQSMLEVGIEEALKQLVSSAGGGFDQSAFEARDGAYRDSSWSRSDLSANSFPALPLLRLASIDIDTSSTTSPAPASGRTTTDTPCKVPDIEDVGMCSMTSRAGSGLYA